jgi:hypothetical protein
MFLGGKMGTPFSVLGGEACRQDHRVSFFQVIFGKYNINGTTISKYRVFINNKP